MSHSNKNVYHMHDEVINNRMTVVLCDCPVYEAYDDEKNEWFTLGKIHLANMTGKVLKNAKRLIASGRYRLHRPSTVKV